MSICPRPRARPARRARRADREAQSSQQRLRARRRIGETHRVEGDPPAHGTRQRLGSAPARRCAGVTARISAMRPAAPAAAESSLQTCEVRRANLRRAPRRERIATDRPDSCGRRARPARRARARRRCWRKQENRADGHDRAHLRRLAGRVIGGFDGVAKSAPSTARSAPFACMARTAGDFPRHRRRPARACPARGATWRHRATRRNERQHDQGNGAERCRGKLRVRRHHHDDRAEEHEQIAQSHRGRRAEGRFEMRRVGGQTREQFAGLGGIVEGRRRAAKDAEKCRRADRRPRARRAS